MDLLKIDTSTIGGTVCNTVNARLLHEFLDVGKDFSNWIKDRIEQYKFIEHQDFEVFAGIGENPKGGRPAKEYSITIDMAKELSMVERTEKGKSARQYFIECERRAIRSHDAALKMLRRGMNMVSFHLLSIDGHLAYPRVMIYPRNDMK